MFATKNLAAMTVIIWILWILKLTILKFVKIVNLGILKIHKIRILNLWFRLCTYYLPKGNHWLGMSQFQTPMQSHTSLTQCPPQGRQLIKRHDTRLPSIQAGTHMFYPIAIETAGAWDDMAIELVQEIGRRTTVITQDTRETVFLFQRLSIALQRGKAVSFLNTMNTE